MKNKFLKNKLAFTLAEALIVLVILGILILLVMSILKPSNYKNQALEIQSRKVVEEIEHATEQILLYDSYEGTFDALYNIDEIPFCIKTNNMDVSQELAKLYQKYVVGSLNVDLILFKSGATMKVVFDENGSKSEFYIPGNNQIIKATSPYGFISVDINGDKLPNDLGKDQYKIPFKKDGLNFNP